MADGKHNAVNGLDKRLKALVMTLKQEHAPSRVRHVYVKRMYCARSLMLAGTGMSKGGYTHVTLPRTVTPYRESVDGIRDHLTYQKLY
jgi:hypothetical protein